MTEQEKINDAAIKYATEKSSAPDKETPDWIIQDFKAGASWYEEKIMSGMMEKLLKWISDRSGDYKISLNDHDWYFESDQDGDFPISEQQLVSEFFEHLKHNQDAGSENKI